MDVRCLYRLVAWSLLISSLSSLSARLPVQAESLFQASATHYAQPRMTPRSLFTQPRPQYVGDIITINVDERTQNTLQYTFRVEKSKEINETGTSVINGVVSNVLDKFLPGSKALETAADVLSVPSINGVDNEDSTENRATVNKNQRVQESITCQVVQVLPNGNLMIQGRKATLFSKERTDIYVTGIVNPYYLDRNNSVASNQVANLQFFTSGNGQISRSQNDGLLTKIYQFIQ